MSRMWSSASYSSLSLHLVRREPVVRVDEAIPGPAYKTPAIAGSSSIGAVQVRHFDHRAPEQAWLRSAPRVAGRRTPAFPLRLISTCRAPLPSGDRQSTEGRPPSAACALIPFRTFSMIVAPSTPPGGIESAIWAQTVGVECEVELVASLVDEKLLEHVDRVEQLRRDFLDHDRLLLQASGTTSSTSRASLAFSPVDYRVTFHIPGHTLAALLPDTQSRRARSHRRASSGKTRSDVRGPSPSP